MLSRLVITFLPRSHFFASDGRSIRASASASVLPMNIQDWFPLGLTGLISLQSKGLKSLLQHHSSKASILRHSAFFLAQLSSIHDYWKNHSLDSMDLCWQSNVCFLICCLGLQETWVGKILELGRSPGEWKGYPDQYSGLENSMDCIVHGFAKSWTRLRYFHFSGLS